MLLLFTQKNGDYDNGNAERLSQWRVIWKHKEPIAITKLEQWIADTKFTFRLTD